MKDKRPDPCPYAVSPFTLLLALTRKEAGRAALAGLLGGVVYLILFPGRSISALMHQVLGLPGPGAGIVLVVGPALLLASLLAYRWTKVHGSFSLSGLVFSVILAAGSQQFRFIAQGNAVVYAGIVLAGFFGAHALALVSAFVSRRSKLLGYVGGAIAANLVIFAIYLFLVFLPGGRWPTIPGMIELLLIGAGAGLVVGLPFGVLAVREMLAETPPVE